MPIKSPKYSFVDFENRMPNIVLKAIDSAAIAFQFYISPGENARPDSSFGFGVIDADGIIVLQAFDPPVLTCLWGIMSGIDLDADFPLTVTDASIIPAVEYKNKDDLFDALQLVGVAATGSIFLQCCDLENVHDLTVSTDKGTLVIQFFAGVYQVTLPATGLADFNANPIVEVGECFRYYVQDNGSSEIFTSNLFQREITDDQYTYVTYSGNESQYTFYYGSTLNINQLWLPMYCRKPNYPEKRTVYLKSNKQYQILNATIEKTREVAVDYLPEQLHDRSAVMMSHDNVHFKNFLIDIDVFKKDNYDVGDIDVVAGVPKAPAKFTITEFFEGRNNNCDKRPICVPFASGGGGGGDCTGVSITPTSLPDAVVGEAYFAHITFNGDSPFIISDEVHPSWMTLTPTGAGVDLTGTPSGGDEATDVTISFTVSNCEGANTDDFADTIDVDPAVVNNISWTYANDVGAPAGRMRIIVNGVTVVNTQAASASGSFLAALGADVEVIVNTTVGGTAETDISGPYTSSTSVTHITSDEFTVVAGSYSIHGRSLAT